MKKLITTCALLTTVTMVGMAQSRIPSGAMKGKAVRPLSTTAAQSAAVAASSGPEKAAENEAKTIQKKYGLNDEQYKAVYSAQLDYQQQIAQAKEQGYEPGPGQTQQMNMSLDQRIQNVMTPDQWAKYSAAKAGTSAGK